MRHRTRLRTVAVLTTTLTTALMTTLSCRERPASSSVDAVFEALNAREMGVAVGLARQAAKLADDGRIISVALEEPSKDSVLAGLPVARVARVTTYDAQEDRLSETLVDVAASRVVATRRVDDAQPMLTSADGARASAIVRKDPRWAAALARRGVTDPSKVAASAWSAGYFGDSTERGRIVRVVPYLRDRPRVRTYLRPIEGLVATVNLTQGVVTELHDRDIVPVAPPLVLEPDDGASSASTGMASQDIGIDGGTIRWRHWRLHVAPHPREGVVLHRVAWVDGTRERTVLYRASVSEMVVPYGDPDRGWFFRNALDEGELGLGQFVAPLREGVDVPAGARFLSATIANDRGTPTDHLRAIAVYERDGGLAWRHLGAARRSRELVVEWMSSVGNYEYGFAWILHEDGMIEQRTTLTGIMSVKGSRATEAHGNRITDLLVAPHHQHFFAFRLDTDIDGAGHNRVVEVDGRPSSIGDVDGVHSAMDAVGTILETESTARRQVAGAAARRWVVQNTDRRNAVGEPVSFSLVPGENSAPLADSSAWIRRRAGFLDAQLWVTPYRTGELYAAGEYPNQSRGGAGLPSFTRGNAAVADADVVLWYVMGITHLPRPEDWPVMPAHVAGFRLVPTGFFEANPLVRAQPKP